MEKYKYILKFNIIGLPQLTAYTNNEFKCGEILFHKNSWFVCKRVNNHPYLIDGSIMLYCNMSLILDDTYGHRDLNTTDHSDTGHSMVYEIHEDGLPILGAKLIKFEGVE